MGDFIPAWESDFAGAIVIDDPIKPEDALSETIRERVNNRFESTIRNRVNSRNTPIIIIMQRLHEHDLCGYLQEIEPEEWTVLSLPCIWHDENGQEQPLWEFKHTLEELHKIERSNSFVFETQYMQNPKPLEGLMYGEFKTYDIIPYAASMKRKNYTDTADTGSDYLCSICYTETPIGNFVTDILYTQKPMEYTEPATAEMLSRNKTEICYVESNNGGRSFGRNVEAQCRIIGNNFTSFNPFTQTANKRVRIFTRSNEVQNLIYFPTGWEHKWPEFASHVKSYRKQQEFNSHDDAEDALTGVIEKRGYFNNEEESQFLSFLAKATPQKQLFLHEVMSRNIHENVSNIKDLDAVIDWFVNSLKIIFPDTPYKQGVLLKAADDNDLKRGFGALLRYFNTGVDGVKLIDVQFEKLGIPHDLQRAIKTDLSKSNTDEAFGALRFDDNLYLINLIDGEIRAKKLMTVHKKMDEADIELFSLGDESDGTKRLFDYIPLILDLIQGGKVFIVDEMERSLHPSLIKQIILLFYKHSKDVSSQLIFTTHESSLMDQKIFRRDEIWLMKKDNNGISSFGRMDNLYNVRFDKMLQNSYLNGEYGATPIFETEEEINKLFSSLK